VSVPESAPALSTPAGSAVPAGQTAASLEALLLLVNALAIRLRQPGKLAGPGLEQLPAAERAVLDIIHRAGAVTVPRIARERSTSRQNIQILVDRLRAEGRLELVSNPSHKRSALVQLTAAGTQWFTANEPLYRDFLSEIEARLGGDEIEAGTAVLRKIQQLLSNGGINKEKPRLSSRQPHAPKASQARRESLAVQEETNVEEFPVNLL
jgi:DNA-binding MarR family transcriptional regulator